MAETLKTRPVALASPSSVPVAGVPSLAPLASTTAQGGLPASLMRSVEERRLFLLAPFAMIVGLVVSVELSEAPNPYVLSASGVVLTAGLALSMRSALRFRVLVLLAFAWLGLCLLPIHGALFGTTMLERPAFGQYQLRVDEVLSESEGEARIVVSAISPLDGVREVPMRRARLFIRDGPDLSPGDVISGQFRFAPVPGAVHPAGFDTQFHAYFDGIGAYGNSTRPPEVVSRGDASAPDYIVDAVRTGIAERIDAVLPQPAAGIARAIINGDQSAVTDEVRETMATAGIVHVLSVSGLHLTIVAGGVFWVVRLLLARAEFAASRVSIKRVAAVTGIAAALFYFAISGGSVAAFRSTLMILLIFGAVLFGRRALTMRNVAIAAVVVIATDPATIFRPSFQLSFAAVIALVGAYENLRSERLANAGLLGHSWAYGKGVVISSLVAGAGTLLFSIYHFQQTSPLGVLGNLLSLPLVGFVMMPAAAGAVLAMPLGLEQPLLLAMGWSIDRMIDMASFVAAWSERLQASPLLTVHSLLLGLAGLAWFAFFRDRWRLIGPVAAAGLVLVFGVDRPPDVLIADTTQAVAVRGASGLQLAAGQPKSFTLDVWRETFADPIDAQAEQGCDEIACVGTSAAGFRYAIVRDPAGFAEECGMVDLVVSRIRAPSYCSAAAVVDVDALDAGGVHWLRWDPSQRKFEIRTSIDRLDRPWRLTP